MTSNLKHWNNIQDITDIEIDNFIAQLEEGESNDIIHMKLKLVMIPPQYVGDNALELTRIFKKLDAEFKDSDEYDYDKHYNDRLYEELKIMKEMKGLMENGCAETEEFDNQKNIEDYSYDYNEEEITA